MPISVILYDYMEALDGHQQQLSILQIWTAFFFSTNVFTHCRLSHIQIILNMATQKLYR